jgi:hypothetical protein
MYRIKQPASPLVYAFLKQMRIRGMSDWYDCSNWYIGCGYYRKYLPWWFL